MLANTPLFAIYGALGPIFCIIVLGHLLKRYGFPDAAFWPAAEQLTYFLLFPALLVHRLALADLGDYAIAPFAGVIVATLGLITILLFLIKPRMGVDGPAFSSIYQGSIRFNTYVGLAAASALLHAPGATLAALAIALLIPLINVLCVAVLSHSNGSLGITQLFAALLRNPLIVACLAGIALNISGLGLPLGTAAVLDLLARAALPLGLLTVGAGLYLQATWSRRRELFLTTALKLLALPALTFLLCRLVGLNDLETSVLVLFTALPGAPSAYILARQLGGDAQLMAAIVTVETAASLATLPLIMALLL
ncbi:MAG: AEC family transporter [Gammaproteobacteria bacterium]|nr:AEC family transporter [Gammaproteobacteria bacterium]